MMGSIVKTFIHHVRRYIIRGIIALIPVVLSALAIHFLRTAMDRRIMRMLEGYVGFRLPGMGILIVLIAIYVFGLIASNAAGRLLFRTLEKISSRIPLVKTTYSVGKQLASTFLTARKACLSKTCACGIHEAQDVDCCICHGFPC